MGEGGRTIPELPHGWYYSSIEQAAGVTGDGRWHAFIRTTDLRGYWHGAGTTVEEACNHAMGKIRPSEGG